MADPADPAGRVRATSPPPPVLPIRPGRPADVRGHPLRVALLDLLAQCGTLTSTQAARELGESSGACSFHLRQLERYGHIEEAPGAGGRARPWRLTPVRPGAQVPPGEFRPVLPGQGREPGEASEAPGEQADEFGVLARELENEGYRRWLAGRASAPPGWHDEAFSAVVTLTPGELDEVAAAIRAVIAARGEPGDSGRPGAGGPGAGAPGTGGRPSEVGQDSGTSQGPGATHFAHDENSAMPVGVVVRMFPLLPASSDD